MPDAQARLMRVVLPLQLIPAGVMLGGVASLFAPGELTLAPVVVIAAGWVAWMIGTLVALTVMAREEAGLQHRLSAASALLAADPGAVSSWPRVPAILSRVPRAGKRAPFRTAMYVADLGARGTLPVAVRLAPQPVPAQDSGARLLLHPHDPAIALLDPAATAGDHAAAAHDPALTGLSKPQRGVAFEFRRLLPWIGAGAAALVLTFLLLLLAR
ncbi:hypothetical protein GCM10010196_19930 [Agromyces mediolanus]|uniref:Uncharacterized protein n=1 Tax=Agromyces mediolanus TaxID=41986 RepID=A0A918CJD7_AGRME|nr:hypothetical protein GCM10010196_19930 [Agromyces mediolanus]